MQLTEIAVSGPLTFDGSQQPRLTAGWMRMPDFRQALQVSMSLECWPRSMHKRELGKGCSNAAWTDGRGARGSALSFNPDTVQQGA